MPIWIRLPNLLLHLWSPGSIGKIVSVIGKPLFIDKSSSDSSKLCFVRVCVEASASNPLPSSMLVEIEGGEEECYEQPIEYESVFKRCNNCKTFGHVEEECLDASKMVSTIFRKLAKKPLDKSTKVLKHQVLTKSPNENTSDNITATVAGNKSELYENATTSEKDVAPMIPRQDWILVTKKKNQRKKKKKGNAEAQMNVLGPTRSTTQGGMRSGCNEMPEKLITTPLVMPSSMASSIPNSMTKTGFQAGTKMSVTEKLSTPEIHEDLAGFTPETHEDLVDIPAITEPVSTIAGFEDLAEDVISCQQDRDLSAAKSQEMTHLEKDYSIIATEENQKILERMEIQENRESNMSVQETRVGSEPSPHSVVDFSGSAGSIAVFAEHSLDNMNQIDLFPETQDASKTVVPQTHEVGPDNQLDFLGHFDASLFETLGTEKQGCDNSDTDMPFDKFAIKYLPPKLAPSQKDPFIDNMFNCFGESSDDSDMEIPLGFTPTKEDISEIRSLMKEGVSLVPQKHQNEFLESVDNAEDGEIFAFFKEKLKDHRPESANTNYSTYHNLRRSPRIKKKPPRLTDSASSSGLKKGFLK